MAAIDAVSTGPTKRMTVSNPWLSFRHRSNPVVFCEIRMYRPSTHQASSASAATSQMARVTLV